MFPCLLSTHKHDCAALSFRNTHCTLTLATCWSSAASRQLAKGECYTKLHHSDHLSLDT